MQLWKDRLISASKQQEQVSWNILFKTPAFVLSFLQGTVPYVATRDCELYTKAKKIFKKNRNLCYAFPYIYFHTTIHWYKTNLWWYSASVQAYVTEIFSACFLLKIKGRKMQFEALSFYLLGIISEKITSYGKREKLLSWCRGSWFSSFSVFRIGHVAYQ